MRRLILAAAAALLVSAQPAHAKTLPDATIPASDGVNLVGDVYLPGDGKGRYPAVVDMEPYGRSSSTAYVKEGFARVNTDVRGSGKSGGALCLLCAREQRDVYDVVEWIARQPWSNGKVALYGYSYSAVTSLLGAALRPPHLEAVVVGHPPTDPYRDVIWHNGLYDIGFVGSWFTGQTATQAVGLGAQPQILDRAQQLFAIETHALPFDGPLYKERSVLDKADRITVPVYMWTGWQDMYSRGDLRLIDALASRHKVLSIDPATHHGTGQAGQVGAPYAGSTGEPESPVALSTEAPGHEDVRWLQHFVQGADNGIERLPRVRYYDLGDREWRSAPTWRSVNTSETELYLSAARSGSARLSPNDGTLAPAVPTGRDAYQESYLFDPLGGLSIPSGKDGPDGFLPYAPLDQNLDQPIGLTYTTPVLRAPLRLAGPSELRLYAITESSDVAFVGKLEDVAPDGSASLITQGWLRGNFRKIDPARSRDGAPYLPDDTDTPVVIGQQTEYRMDIWDTAYSVQPGHRLRLWLSSSDTPTHEPPKGGGRYLIFHDDTAPSRLILGTRGDVATCGKLPQDCPPLAPATTPRACTRTRTLQPRLTAPRGQRVVAARVFVNGRRVRTLTGRRLTALLTLRDLPRGTVRVRVVGRTNRGRTVTDSRTFHVCPRRS